MIDPSAVFIQENVQEKVIYDPPCKTNNVVVAADGRIAVMTRHTVHIYEPQFTYTAFFHVSWIVLTPSLSSKVSESTDYLTQISQASLNENRLFLMQIAWIPNPVRSGESDVLCVLCNDGEMWLFRRAFACKEEVVLGSGSGTTTDKLAVQGYQLLTRISTPKSITHPTLSCHIVRLCRCVIQDTQQAGRKRILLFGMTKDSEVLVWELASTDSHTIQTSLLKHYQLPHLQLHFTAVSGIITMVHADTIEVVIGYREGALRRLTVDRTTLDMQANGQMISTHSLAVEKLYYMQSHVIFSCNNTSYRIDLDSPNHCVPLADHSLEVSGMAALRDWSLSQDAVLLSAALDSSMKYVTAKDGLIQSNQAIELEAESRAKYGIYGLASDALSMLAFYSFCNPGMIGNSREVQMNVSLAKHRTVLSWRLNPSIEVAIMKSLPSVAQWLLSIIGRTEGHDENTEGPTSMAYLPLAILGLMDAVKKHFRKLPMKPLPEQIKRAQEIADLNIEGPKRRSKARKTAFVECDSDSDVENGEEDEEEEEEEDDASVEESSDSEYEQEMGSAQKRSSSSAKKSTKKKAGGKKKKGGKDEDSNEQGGFGLTFIYEKLRDFMDPDPITLAHLAQDLVHKACMIAAYVLHHDFPRNFQHWSRNDVLQLEQEHIINNHEIFLQFPSCRLESKLKEKLQLWQMWYMLMISLVKIRRPQPEDSPWFAEHQDLMDAIRGQIILANTVVRCQSLLSQPLERNLAIHEKRTIYYMIQILHQYLQHYHDDGMTELYGSMQSAFHALLTDSGLLQEQCCICNMILPFETTDPLHSTCPQCQLTINRCVFSHQLVTTPILEGQELYDEVIYRCGICGAAANGHWLQNAVDLCESILNSNCAICPFCVILMKREH